MIVRGRNPHSAFTLAELVIAASITAVIGLAVGALATGLAHAHSHSDSMRESIQSARMGVLRMEDALRAARLVTCADAGRLIVWVGDTNEDKQINIGELLMFRHRPEEQMIERWQIRFPPTMLPAQAAALDVPVTLEEATEGPGVESCFSRAIYAGYLSRPVLANRVTDFSMTAAPGPPQTQLMRVRLTVGEPAQRITLSNAARLRADATEYVAQAQGAWVLNLP